MLQVLSFVELFLQLFLNYLELVNDFLRKTFYQKLFQIYHLYNFAFVVLLLSFFEFH